MAACSCVRISCNVVETTAGVCWRSNPPPASKKSILTTVGIQSRVVSRSGLDLASVNLAHVNRDYVFDGGSIDPRKFFKIRNLSRRVQRLQPKLTFQLRAEFTVLNMPNAPDLPPGPDWAHQNNCEFYDRCKPPLPDDHIGYLPRI